MCRLVIRIEGSAAYFHGYDYDPEFKSNKAKFGKYNDGMKIYCGESREKAERKAKAAVRNIGSIGCDMAPYLEIVEASDPIPYEIIDDEPAEPPKKPEPVKEPEPFPLWPLPDTESGGWEHVDGIIGKSGKIIPPLMCRRTFGECWQYAVFMPDGKYYDLPGDELLAWKRYCHEREKFICERIRERRRKEGKDPDGMDEWKEERQ